MASSTEIANLALIKLGESPLLALTDDTKAGRTMNRLYLPTLYAELRMNWWKFATKRATLLALVDSPEWGFQYQYPLPADFIGLVQVNDLYARVRDQQGFWSLETGTTGAQVLMTNLVAPLRIKYIYRLESSGQYDPLFVQALACRLALEACEDITQSNTKKAALRQDYELAMRHAMRVDALERVPDDLAPGSWLDAREGTFYGTAEDWSIYSIGTPIA